VADRVTGIHVVDIRNPASPVRLPSVGTEGRANWVLWSGGLTYVANGTEGLRIIDSSCY
jgi:hypothetical protein